MPISFFVPGIPAPGGSKKAFVNPKTKRVVVVDDAKRNGPWRDRVASFARDHLQGRPPLSGPLRVSLDFVVPRPKGHYGTGKNAGKVRDSAPPYPAVKPDALKLARSTEDALTGVLWIDDAQTVVLTISKRYGETPGVEVLAYSLADQGDAA